MQSSVDVIQVHAIDRSVANQLHPGQDAVLRFSAFNQRTTLEVLAKVETVAADLATNPQTGEAWYSIRIRIPAEEMTKLRNLTLL